MYEQERPFDYPGSSQGDPSGEVVYDECFNCHAEVPETEGEHQVVHTHRIEGRAVAQDTEFICYRCSEDEGP